MRRSSRLSSEGSSEPGAGHQDNDDRSDPSSDDGSYRGGGGGGGRKSKGTGKGKGAGDLGGNRGPLDTALNACLVAAENITQSRMDPSSARPLSLSNPTLSAKEKSSAPLNASFKNNTGLGMQASSTFVAATTGSSATVRRGLRGHSMAFNMTRGEALDMKRCRQLWVYLFVMSCEVHGGLPRWSWIDTFLNSKLP